MRLIGRSYGGLVLVTIRSMDLSSDKIMTINRKYFIKVLDGKCLGVGTTIMGFRKSRIKLLALVVLTTEVTFSFRETTPNGYRKKPGLTF